MPSQVITNCKTAREMQKALQIQYEGSGIVLNYNTIETYVHIKYENFKSLEVFIISFNKVVNKLSTLQIPPPDTQYLIMFIISLQGAQPIQSERQRSNYRNSLLPTLVQLIQDITDKARNKDSRTSSAMYGNRTFRVPNKKPSSDRLKCLGCSMEKPRHPPTDCFTTNHEKRKTQEKEHDKKQIIIKNRKKVDSSDSKSKKSKKDKDKDKGKKKDNEKSESDDNKLRFRRYTSSRYALTIEYKITKAMSVLKSIRWLVDTGADQYFCHSRE